MKKQNRIIGIIVIAGLGLGVMVGCSTSRRQVGSNSFTVFAAPSASQGTKDGCPGAYAGYVNYTLSAPTWGWAKSTNTANHTASDGGGRTNTSVQYLGLYGDNDCGITNVTLPASPPSPAYQFTIYFPSNPPTTNYPIVLSGFNTN
ncbi:MAG: hypothetical protein ABSE48_14575 [Verrucomicrobiota bacterium]|jgi:hypothetical protein